MSSVFLYCFALCAVVGVLLAGSVSVPLTVCIVVACLVYGRYLAFNSGPIYLVCTGLCVVLLFAWRTQATQIIVPDLAGVEIFEGVVIEEPDVRDTHTKLVIQTDATRLLVTAPIHPAYAYGDQIVIAGRATLPEAFETETGRVFQYDKYLHMRGITHQVFRPEIIKVDEQKGNVIKHVLFGIKYSLLANIKMILPEPHSALVGGVVFGAKESLGEQLLEDFRRTGLIHIVVLSGYNVTIIAEALMRSLMMLSVYARAGLGAGAIICFAIMTGAGATIVRASVMAILVIVARATGRVSDMNRLLVLAGLSMLWFNPMILVYDASFQLSFIATWGLLNITPRIEKRFTWMTARFGLRDIVSATIATQIAVLPLLAYMMGEVSIVAPLVNVLVLPIIPFMMLGGFLTGFFGGIISPFAEVFGFITYVTTTYTFAVVELFSSLFIATIALL